MKEQTTTCLLSRKGLRIVATSTLLEALRSLGIPEQAALILSGFRIARPGSEPQRSHGTLRPDAQPLVI